jgi:hypothetical protein
MSNVFLWNEVVYSAFSESTSGLREGTEYQKRLFSYFFFSVIEFHCLVYLGINYFRNVHFRNMCFGNKIYEFFFKAELVFLTPNTVILLLYVESGGILCCLGSINRSLLGLYRIRLFFVISDSMTFNPFCSKSIIYSCKLFRTLFFCGTIPNLLFSNFVPLRFRN